jgi:uncharacterized protein YkvS
MTRNSNFLEGNYQLYQRAFINGFMEKDKALKFYNQLKNNPNYIVSLSCMENNFDQEFDVCTLSAKDGRLMYDELYEHDRLMNELNLQNKFFDNDTVYKNIPNIHTTYYSRNKLEIPNIFKSSFERYLKNMEEKYFEDNVIVKVSIMDKRWNHNDEFWNDILKCLSEC